MKITRKQYKLLRRANRSARQSKDCTEGYALAARLMEGSAQDRRIAISAMSAPDEDYLTGGNIQVILGRTYGWRINPCDRRPIGGPVGQLP